jgi:hypothetical protein
VNVIKRQVVVSKVIPVPQLQKIELKRKKANLTRKKSPPKITKMSNTNKDFVTNG